MDLDGTWRYVEVACFPTAFCGKKRKWKESVFLFPPACLHLLVVIFLSKFSLHYCLLKLACLQAKVVYTRQHHCQQQLTNSRPALFAGNTQAHYIASDSDTKQQYFLTYVSAFQTRQHLQTSHGGRHGS